MSQRFTSSPPPGSSARPPLRTRLLALVVRPTAPPLWLGIVVATAFIVGETLLVQQLKQVAPENAFGVLFLVGVLVISAGWGFRLAVATTLASAVVYIQFHMDTGVGFIPTHPQDALAILIFLPVALLANLLGGQARLRAAEAEQRRREADLAADLGRLMLRAGDLRPALDAAGQRMAQVLGLPFTVLAADTVAASEHQSAIPLRDGDAPLGTLLVPADLPKPVQYRLQRLVPSLELLLAAARDREAINAELEASRRELERFFDLTSDLFFISDETHVRRLNPASERIFGFTTTELQARPYSEFIHPDDRNRTRSLVEALTRNGGAAQFENRCVRSDGAVRWLEWSVVAANGLLYGAARDVTDRRREQDRLREAQRMVEASHAEVSALAEQQAALRRVATLVARGVDPAQVYPAAVAELSRGLGIDNVALLRYESGEALVLLAARDESGLTKMPIGERIPLDGYNVLAMILDTNAPARINSFDGATGPTAERIRRLGLRSAVGAPIIIDGRVWGALVIGSSQAEPLPPETEARIGDFADLVATAISNAETHAELTASRARIVTAGDQARRRFERDLHDGAQQRLVTLVLNIGVARRKVADESVAELLAAAERDAREAIIELRHLATGLHPPVLSESGLAPALAALARRTPLEVEVLVTPDERFDPTVEVAAYFVVTEALTNVVKHAEATLVRVSARREGMSLVVKVEDDGRGGANPQGGSGLVGLTDRVEALRGTLSISSSWTAGTLLRAEFPLGG
jgi:PAS domain S-box-containing protein